MNGEERRKLRDASSGRRFFNEGLRELKKVFDDKKSKYERCVELFSRAIECDGSCGRYFFQRGNCFRHLGDFDRAEEDYIAAIEKNEKSDYWLQRGINQRLKSVREDDGSCLRDSYRFLNFAIEKEKESARRHSVYYFERALTNYEMSRMKPFRRVDKLKESIEDFKRAEELCGEEKRGKKKKKLLFKIYYHRGNTYREMGLLSASIRDLSAAAEQRGAHAGVQNNLGLSMYELGAYDKALSRFSEALKQSEGQTSTMGVYYNNRGLALVQLKRYAEAIENFCRSIELDKDEGSFYFNRGHTYLRMREYELALRDFSLAIDKVDDDENYYHCKGLCYEEMGQRAKAMDCFRKALSMNEEHAPSLYHLGLMHHAQHDYFDARECFIKAQQRKPGDRRIVESLGKVHQDLLDFDLAVEDFSAAMAIQKTHKNLFYRATSFLWLGKKDEAIKDLLESVALIQKQDEKFLLPSIYNALALAYKQKGNFPKSLAYFENAIKEEKEHDNQNEHLHEYLFNRSQCYFDRHEKGDIQRAIHDLTRAAALQPAEAKFFYLRGLCFYSSGEHKKVILDLKNALRLQASSGFTRDAYYHIGLSYAHLNKPHKAIEAFTRAIEAEPHKPVPKYFHERGKAYQVLNMNESALKDFTKVLQLQPKNPHAHFRRAFAYKALNDFHNAAKSFEKAKQLDPKDTNLVVNYKKIYNVDYIQLCKPGEERM